jgi:outer membrane immunogenic protein
MRHISRLLAGPLAYFLAWVVATAALTVSAIAADMAMPPPAIVIGPFAPYNWAGPYVGGTAGYAFGTSQHCDTVAACTSRFNVDGFAGGGTLGYNWQGSNWVAGLETDFSGAVARGTTPSSVAFGCGFPQTCYTNLNWFGTVRARFGPTYDSWFPYVTGGFAYGGLKAGLGSSVPPSGLSASGAETGWTLGAGVEYALPMNHWSVKLEYLYFQLGNLFYDTAHLCAAQSCTAMHNDFSVVRLGANYRF